VSRPLRIALLKPDYGVVGGFERVVARIEGIFRAAGHDLTRLTVDMAPPDRSVAGLAVSRSAWAAAPEYFPYLVGRDGFDRLDTRRYDVVISTQPPSFSHRHPRHLAIFYHHHRVFYDLEELYLRAGFAADPEVHRRAGELIRRLDQPRIEAIRHILAPSQTVADRLARFNGVTGVGFQHAGIGVGSERAADGDPGTGPVLCIGRHEFPKRAELAVAAAHLLPHLRFTVVGSGGRMAWARSIDQQLSRPGADPTALTDAELWCNTGQGAPEVPAEGETTSNVTFAGFVTDDELDQLNTEAPCVVAPAYDEDYGLTAIEAMAHGRPVVVCDDGGGLAELVEHEVTGLVVPPTAAGIAGAVERLTTDRTFAAHLGRNGRVRAAGLTWADTATELQAGLDRVLED
jgi:glycosyltransferase involved in cell wall biosynthesis